MGFFARKYDQYILGIRPGFGSARITLEHAGKAARRKWSNWTLPGLLALFFLFAIVVIMSWLFGNNGDGIFVLAIRIILFDYIIFMFGWLCGWSAAWRWRRNQSFVEELVTTNLRPSIVGNVLFAGSLAIWWRILLLISAVDVLMLVVYFVNQYPLTLSSDNVLFNVAVWIVFFLCCLMFAVVLAWFHLESLRIAYWMFAVTALPRLNLIEKAISNFFMIPIYVGVLTAVGSIITSVLIMLPIALVGIALPHNQTADLILPLAPLVAAIPGMIMVGYLKRMLTSNYEQDFALSYLMFQWWGAAEIEHPRKYDFGMIMNARRWLMWLREEERQDARGEKEGAVS